MKTIEQILIWAETVRKMFEDSIQRKEVEDQYKQGARDVLDELIDFIKGTYRIKL